MGGKVLEKEFRTGEDAKQYEQMITLCGMIIVKAMDKEDAENKIKSLLDELVWGEGKELKLIVKGMENVELIIGEYEREDEVKEEMNKL